MREKYDYLYKEEELARLVPEIEAVTGEAEETYVSFNNNNRDYPVRNALMLKRLLRQPVPEVPGPRGGAICLSPRAGGFESPSCKRSSTRPGPSRPRGATSA